MGFQNQLRRKAVDEIGPTPARDARLGEQVLRLLRRAALVDGGDGDGEHNPHGLYNRRDARFSPAETMPGDGHADDDPADLELDRQLRHGGRERSGAGKRQRPQCRRHTLVGVADSNPHPPATHIESEPSHAHQSSAQRRSGCAPYTSGARKCARPPAVGPR